MIGRSEQIPDWIAGATVRRADTPALELRGVATALGHRDIDPHACTRGEILGLYGLVGAGRSELARAILGADAPITAGELEVDGAAASASATSHEALHRYRHRLCQRGPQGRRV